jgi:hypothetical protein
MIGSNRQRKLTSVQAAPAAPAIGLGSQPVPRSFAEQAAIASTLDGPAPYDPGQVALDTSSLGAPVPKMGGNGILSKIGDALKAPGVSAALLRSAGATLNGGLGAGIQAATSFMDRRRLEDQQQQMAALDFALRQRLAANTELATRQTGAFQNGRLANEREGNQIRLYGIDTGARTAMRGQDIGERGNIRNNQTAMRNTDVSAGTSRLNNRESNAQSDINSRRSYAGTMINRGPERSVTTTTKATPGESANWLSKLFGATDTQAVPATSTTVKSRLPQVNSDADYDALPKNAQFFAPDGTIRTKQ